MMKCFVIDDEPLAIKLLSNYVDRHESLELVKAYHNPIQALHEYEQHEVDLIFLDIQMPELSGIQFLKILNNRCPVILTTAYDQYALESYDYKVVDYLVKPISFERFSKAIEKFISLSDRISKEKETTSTNEKNETESIFIKSGHKTVRVELKSLTHLESKGDYLFLFTENEELKTLENLKDIIQRLPSNFVRCHRSFVVNMDRVNFIENNRVVIGKEYIPISRAYLQAVNTYIQDNR